MAISLMGNGYIREAYQIFSDYMENMSEDWNIGYACYARCCFELGLMEKYKKNLRNSYQEKFNRNRRSTS